MSSMATESPLILIWKEGAAITITTHPSIDRLVRDVLRAQARKDSKRAVNFLLDLAEEIEGDSA